MKTGRKATRNRTREGVLGLTFLCVCVCSRAAFFSSRSACDVCSVSRKTSKKVRVCKNYEEISTKKFVKKGKKAGKRRDARRRKKHKALFSLIPFCALRSLYYASSFILVVEKSYTHKRDGERENDAMWEKEDDTLNDSIVLRVLFIYARGPSST